jgi:hypothetical protein
MPVDGSFVYFNCNVTPSISDFEYGGSYLTDQSELSSETSGSNPSIFGHSDTGLQIFPVLSGGNLKSNFKHVVAPVISSTFIPTTKTDN